MIGIVAAGAYVPQTVLTSADMAERTGIPEAIIREKFGMTQKPIPGADDHTNAMALWAAQDALRRTDMHSRDIDLGRCTTAEWTE